MSTMDFYLPTRIVFGEGRLDDLASPDLALPGMHPLVCTTRSTRKGHADLLQRVLDLLDQRGICARVYAGFTPNPTKDEVEEAVALAVKEGCDFVIGLGGGSSIDAAKAVALLMVQGGDLWEYAYTGTGGRKEITGAAPVVAITTTAGTGTESDPYSVITKTETGEKLDFAADVLFPAVSLIDPLLMLSLPRDLTIYQGIDAFFHAAECFITNQGKNRLVDVYAQESLTRVLVWLPVIVDEPGNVEGRTELAYAANICSGCTQSLVGTTSHHIIAQTIGGLFPAVPHGATLIMIAEEYYRHIARFVPEQLNQLGCFFDAQTAVDQPGGVFVKGLAGLFESLGIRHLAMSSYGISPDDLPAIADAAVNRTGLDGIDHYPLDYEDVLGILERSFF